MRCYPFRTAGGISATGNFQLWGTQLVLGRFASSLIYTGASTVSRAPDIITATGANFTSFWNAAEGSVFAEFLPNAPIPSGINQYVFGINDGTANNRVSTFRDTNGAMAYRVIAGNAATMNRPGICGGPGG